MDREKEFYVRVRTSITGKIYPVYARPLHGKRLLMIPDEVLKRLDCWDWDADRPLKRSVEATWRDLVRDPSFKKLGSLDGSVVVKYLEPVPDKPPTEHLRKRGVHYARIASFGTDRGETFDNGHETHDESDISIDITDEGITFSVEGAEDAEYFLPWRRITLDTARRAVNEVRNMVYSYAGEEDGFEYGEWDGLRTPPPTGATEWTRHAS